MMITTPRETLAAWDAEIVAELRAVEDERDELAQAALAAEETAAAARDRLTVLLGCFPVPDLPLAILRRIEPLQAEVRTAERRAMDARGAIERGERQRADLIAALAALAAIEAARTAPKPALALVTPPAPAAAPGAREDVIVFPAGRPAA